jgi:hypothetical protein
MSDKNFLSDIRIGDFLREFGCELRNSSGMFIAQHARPLAARVGVRSGWHRIPLSGGIRG